LLDKAAAHEQRPSYAACYAAFVLLVQFAFALSDCFHTFLQYIDTEEYPSTEKIKEMCVSMLADLWHAGAAYTP
jgi:glutamate/tyrosine decarboxylase-like PLP-dependent enzyme